MDRVALICVAVLFAAGCFLYMRRAKRPRGRRAWSWYAQLALCIAVFAVAMYLQVYLMPAWADQGGTINNLSGNAIKTAVNKKDAAKDSMTAIEKYKKFVTNLGGTRKQQQGEAVAVMQAHHRVEDKRYAQNAQDNAFAGMAEVYRAGLGDDTAQAMSTAINNDLQFANNRNVKALEGSTFTHPSLVGEYNRGSQGAPIDAVPQAVGGPFRATTGLSPELAKAGPRATESEQDKIEGRNANLIREEATSSGLMSSSSESSAADNPVYSGVFNAPLAAAEDDEALMQEAIAAASSR